MATIHKNVQSGNPLKADRAAARAAAAASQAAAKQQKQAAQLAAQQTTEANHLALIQARQQQQAQAQQTRLAAKAARQAARTAKVQAKTNALAQEQQNAIAAQTAANNAAMQAGYASAAGVPASAGDLIGGSSGGTPFGVGTLADTTAAGGTDPTAAVDPSATSPATGMSTKEKVLIVGGIVALAGYAYYRR